MGSHDQLFKELLERFLGDLLHLVAPRLARRLAPERRSLLPTEGFTDSPHGQQRLPDLVAEVPVQGPRSPGEPESLVGTREKVEGTTTSSRLEEIADRLLTAESLDDLGLG